ncbi:hypothetical protein [Paracidovorax konjaci]|uniref:Uncharacterized protein n=1 Tax=Paracidovorax konjaci TaxID=32040 RepID=A0A1I1V2N2_9BURK|nr:hypothetical protein [Paracidovorax konjaci]SFD77332.1 hypothetical protein SAMN04489710_1069 [Paracidovorax konjaci]
MDGFREPLAAPDKSETGLLAERTLALAGAAGQDDWTGFRNPRGPGPRGRQLKNCS